MSGSSNSRRQFIKQTGKAGIAMASMPIIHTFSGLQLSQEVNYMQQPLPYAFNALEPFIDAMTMEIHHTKHAAGYTKNLNDACIAEKIDIKTTIYFKNPLRKLGVFLLTTTSSIADYSQFFIK